MKRGKRKLVTLLVATFLFTLNFIQAQEKKISASESTLTVFGTSNIHDWEVVAKTMGGSGEFVIENGALTEVKSLSYLVVSESLKSGKSGMDKNTYKALKTDDYKNITFKLTSVSKITKNTNGSFTISAQGKLTMCGVAKTVNQQFTAKIVGEKVILSGKQTLDMTTYGIEPPTALMGTIKTGKDVTVDFAVTYK